MAETKNEAAKSSRRQRVLSSIYNYTNNVAESREYGSNIGVTAGAAATLLGMSLDRMEGRKLDGEFEYSEEDIEQITSMALSAEEDNLRKKRDLSHFVDRFMERLVKNTMAPDSAEAEMLNLRMNDPSRNKKPPLSIRILTTNLKRLSPKMGIVFKLQYGLIHVVTWRKPTKTLSVLVVYTAVCLWPHLVLAFPTLFLLLAVIIPSYLYRHPMQTPELIPVRKRGQSLLEFFNESEDSSVLMDILHERHVPYDENLLQSVSSASSDTATTSRTESKPTSADDRDVEDKLDRKDHTKFVKSQVSLLMNMRDLQNLTTDLLNGMDHSEKMATNLFAFKDERLTTFIFYVAIALTWVVLFLGRYIPWRMIFILSGWAVMGACHPHSKKYLVALQKQKKPRDVDTKNENVKVDKESFLDNFDRQDIIVDDLPEVRMVEIFELETRNVLRHEWRFYAYSKRLFAYEDTVRVAGKFPHGVDSLSKVLPPKEWKYDFGYANNWRIDVNPSEFLSYRDIDQLHLRVSAPDEDGWIYDKLPLDREGLLEFRRRRLYRECYRYARPVKTITIE